MIESRSSRTVLGSVQDIFALNTCGGPSSVNGSRTLNDCQSGWAGGPEMQCVVRACNMGTGEMGRRSGITALTESAS
ncbi:unnamed protein product [Protopolystoma xenopodis]|uniref:Uncharacterized protein n=1 Tax=Protopolystoma xenopodis TaxID=117903 RepID=A0A3S5C4I9_9PLAT|nr:unnamed protein product [Protopolystoma xenopodis]